MNKAIIRFGRFLDGIMSKILHEDVEDSYDDEAVKIVRYSTRSIFPNEAVKNNAYVYSEVISGAHASYSNNEQKIDLL